MSIAPLSSGCHTQGEYLDFPHNNLHFHRAASGGCGQMGILVSYSHFPTLTFLFFSLRSPGSPVSITWHASPSVGSTLFCSTYFIPFHVIQQARGKASVPSDFIACNKEHSIGGDAGRLGSGSDRRVRPYGTPAIMAAFIMPQLSTVYRTIASHTTPSLTPHPSISSGLQPDCGW